ncbi:MULTISPECIES: carbohydrate kinase family protein [Streptomyces]|uniref:Carbohydrate kinase family protein n=1 Tax=Streptomyces caniscabiei TaxID=2746961 RepID=A0ABU4MZJ8_9ACTN|nr:MULTISPECIES: carbohydrate kinase family protein [Streptomyces]MBE4740361.1 carbohydrate kinase family protein [Streptomyces caniscabiei]MBE4759613.1 carbohydrate kinase family protein [Streptomyces caniscabiei]MBE4773103.1 carbohydrate kinase family protein [Streptomyces caniscabiei]MBE4788662.1 carbohydrate kinase family protein [Streptomyces caniscabiei]MBE4797858.1 carbohydrate kinase family protein [Streptomyces caniscabiei]
MRIAVTGSIATDHLATFPGRFADQLIEGRLDRVSLSFLVDDLDVRRGGAAANIAFGLGVLGLTPLLVGAVGADFDEYGILLEEHGVDTGHVHVSDTRQTARFMCTTDADQNQIASFYAGAMAEASRIDLARVADRGGALDLVVVSPNDPAAMLRHTEQCRELGIPFAADPSQQLARLDRDEVRRLVEGAAWLFTNEYEAALLLRLSGWTREEVLARAGTWITTRGAQGVRIDTAGAAPGHFPAVPARRVVDPTGVGDAFRAGFLAARSWGLPLRAAVPLGCALATTAAEALGPQSYAASPTELLERVRDTYGDEVGALLAPRLARAVCR